LNKTEIIDWFMGLQDRICGALEALDEAGKFREDKWNRAEGGGGRTRIIKGKHIEKGGVNFSHVHGKMPEKISSALGIAPTSFDATGVSIVLHPVNPFVPIIHMNVRYFETAEGPWWFGGGIDLTPHYINPDDAQKFHLHLKNVCDQSDISFYPKYKKWADDYFFIKHRNETRGVGGIFFDRLDESTGYKKSTLFEFVQGVGNAFVPIYSDVFTNNYQKEYNETHQAWQSIRRGRYVEFNLVWDRGTKFGLETNGRTESILMSLPPLANWVYDKQVENASEEEFTQNHLKKNIDWINYS